MIEAEHILIDGLVIMDSELVNLFQVDGYRTLELSRFNILNSYIENFIIATNGLKVNVNDITVIDSSIKELISIVDADYIQISKLLFYNCYLHT